MRIIGIGSVSGGVDSMRGGENNRRTVVRLDN